MRAGILVAILLLSSANNSPSAGKASSGDDSRVAWLKQHAIPLHNIDPNNEDFLDLEPLAEAIGDARIVQLGEQTHGDWATFHAQTRLIKFLHKKHGFDVLAFESGLYDCHKAWELLQDGREPDEAFRHGVFGIWTASEQVSPLIEYWGQVAKSDHPLELCGFDCQCTARASRTFFVEDMKALLDKLDPAALNDEQRAAILERLGKLPESLRKRRKHCPEELKPLHDALSTWRKLLETARPSPLLPETELAFWRQFMASTSTFAGVPGEPANLTRLRDPQMAHDLVWLPRTAYPTRRIIVWAASSHITRNSPSGWNQTSMGHEVWKVLGEEVYTIAFTAAEGWWKVPAMRMPENLQSPTAGSIEDLLVRAGFENAFVDFRGLDPEGAWLGEPLVARPFGYANHEADWTERFDGIVFIREMFGSTKAGEKVVLIAPIHQAARMGDLDKVEACIEQGTNVNAKNNLGNTPLHLAVAGGHVNIVELLISRRANVKARNNWGWTPLHNVSLRGYKKIAEILMQRGADVNARRVAGWTPLHQAVAEGYVDISELLIRSGADVNYKKDDGRTPLDLATGQDHVKLIELLRKHGAKE